MIVCPADVAAGGTAYNFLTDTSGQDLALNKWVMPYYIGVGTMAEVIGYVWTDVTGAARSYKA